MNTIGSILIVVLFFIIGNKIMSVNRSRWFIKMIQSENLWIDLDKKRIGLTPIIIILQTELAAIAIYYVSKLNDFPTFIIILVIAYLASIGNALNIACVNMRYIIYFFGTSCMASILSMLYCLSQ